MDNTAWLRNEIDFVHRRAWRFGVVEKHDLRRAFGFSTKTATRRIEQALEEHDSRRIPYLTKKQGKRGVFPHLRASRPLCASENNLLSSLPFRADPGMFFCLTGVTEDEIKLQRSAWVQSRPLTPGTLDVILHALRSSPKVVEATYTSLSRGDHGRKARFVPLSMQLIGEQVGIYCYCLTYTYPNGDIQQVEATRSFVVSRMTDAKLIREKPSNIKKIHLRLPSNNEPYMASTITLNPDYTSQQCDIIRHELGVEGGLIHRPVSEMFQFLRMFSDKPANGIWPPLRLVKDPTATTPGVVGEKTS